MFRIVLFQSRNRESYLFKEREQREADKASRLSFNLVIENLIFSRGHWRAVIGILRPFQSRNRESYLFKSRHCDPRIRERSILCFNLVIESLIFSRIWCDSWIRLQVSFNLVIESLIFSSQPRSEICRYSVSFQSRNRESYLFKIRFAICI